MAILLQVPSDLESWINTIVILVIVGGSVLGPVAKWLIGKTHPGPKDAPEEDSRGKREDEPGAARGRVPSARPIARPMPTPGQQRETAERPQITPLPSRPAQRPTVAQRQEPVAPVIPPPPRVGRPRPPDRVAPPPAKRRLAKAPRSQRRIAVKPKEPKLGHLELGLHDTLGEEENRRFAKRQRELGTLQTKRKDIPAAGQGKGEFELVRHPTRRSLRHAILMSEILGPPRALSPLDDRF